jgi:fumarate reductase flavoprotein subunit
MTGREVDVAIVGGGLAGLSAAVRSAERGAEVLVLERGEDERYLCNSRLAMGFFTIASLDMRSDPAVVRATIDRVTGGESDAELASRFASESGPSLTWLIKQGVTFIKFGPPETRRPLLTPLIPLRPGLNWRGRGADTMLRKLEARLTSLGGRILRSHRAEELLVDGDRCTGLVARSDEEILKIAAKAVVVADGGFQSNLDLLRKYISPHPEQLLQRNAGAGHGDGLLMAEAIGGALTGMGDFYGHVHSADALTNPGLWPYPTVDLPISAGIVVDHNGRRFCDEGKGGIYVANAIARLNRPSGAVAIFDHAIWDGPATSFLMPANPNLVRQGATIHRAASIAELAAMLGMSSDTLSETVATHNGTVDADAFDRLNPPRSTSAFKPLPIRTPPFYGVQLCAGITYTMGGIAIDGMARVKRKAGGVFRGLYAAGSTTGGHEGGSRSGYTGGLAKALTFGLIAANDICDRLESRGL